MMSWFWGEEIEWRRLTVETLWPVRGCLDNRLRPFVGVLGLAVGMTWSGRLSHYCRRQWEVGQSRGEHRATGGGRAA
jgi:hypothetical protein